MREGLVEVTYRYLPKTEVSPTISSHQALQELASKYGTPFFLIEEPCLYDKLRELEDGYKDYVGPVKVAFSMKANFNPAVLKIFASMNVLFDVTSTGELAFYLRCGGRPENVIYTSVTETEEEFYEALERGVERIVVGSYNGLLNLIEATERKQAKPRVMIRVNPEVGVKAEVRASYRHGKFGVPFNTPTVDSARSLLRKILETQEFTFEGFHFHLGSQIEDPACYVNALEKLEAFVIKMRKDLPGLKVGVIDIGGGTPVAYSSPVSTPKEMGTLVCGKLNSMVQTLGDHFTLIIESGRFLSAEACTLVSRVVNTKVYGGHKFIFVDAGYHLLLDAALLRQEYPIEVVPDVDPEEGYRITLAGRLCDTYDIFPLPPDSKLSGAERGKFVAFKNVGAYSIVFNMPFHCQTKPPVLLHRHNGDFVLVRKAETVDELFEEEGGSLSKDL